MFLLSSVLTAGLRPHLPVLLTPCSLSGPFNTPSAQSHTGRHLLYEIG